MPSSLSTWTRWRRAAVFGGDRRRIEPARAARRLRARGAARRAQAGGMERLRRGQESRHRPGEPPPENETASHCTLSSIMRRRGRRARDMIAALGGRRITTIAGRGVAMPGAPARRPPPNAELPILPRAPHRAHRDLGERAARRSRRRSPDRSRNRIQPRGWGAGHARLRVRSLAGPLDLVRPLRDRTASRLQAAARHVGRGLRAQGLGGERTGAERPRRRAHRARAAHRGGGGADQHDRPRRALLPHHQRRPEAAHRRGHGRARGLARRRSRARGAPLRAPHHSEGLLRLRRRPDRVRRPESDAPHRYLPALGARPAHGRRAP